MYKIFQVMFFFSISFVVLYAVDKYETKKMIESLQEMELVSPNSLNKLSIVSYPDVKTYMSFDYQEVQDTYRAIQKLDVKEAKPGNGVGSYMKIRFSEDGMLSFIEYYLYENGYLTRAEDAISVSTYFNYKTDEAELKELIEELLAEKTFD
ncbi:hypothetical protein [Solibacillus daqui]|uniref:hypothetical protein n=1 Tax=Solibacillus daqui TaxID=2912187 RepID=UPI0023672597|nr:hypothetical protein [Solibacillus daqui]